MSAARRLGFHHVAHAVVPSARGQSAIRWRFFRRAGRLLWRHDVIFSGSKSSSCTVTVTPTLTTSFRTGVLDDFGSGKDVFEFLDAAFEEGLVFFGFVVIGVFRKVAHLNCFAQAFGERFALEALSVRRVRLSIWPRLRQSGRWVRAWFIRAEKMKLRERSCRPGVFAGVVEIFRASGRGRTGVDVLRWRTGRSYRRCNRRWCAPIRAAG